MNAITRCRACAVMFLGLVSVAAAHTFIGPAWPSGVIPLQLQLDATATQRVFPLLDGARDWNSVAEAALADWNALLSRSRLVGTRQNTTTIGYRDGINQVVFARDAYGMQFPGRFAAVTYVQPHESDPEHPRTVEADVLVNLTLTWNSYRGPASAVPELRRVLLHEFGHALGLGHPDEATPRQFVSSIMNSSLTNVETLQNDDQAGINILYNAPIPRPVFTTQPASNTVNTGASVSLAIAIDGQSPPAAWPLRTFRWYFKAPGAAEFEPLLTLPLGSLAFNLAQPSDAGSYFYRISTPDHTVDSEPATLTVNPVATNAGTTLANLSTRGMTYPGPASMIVGFAVAGPRPKRVLVRSIGATLRGAPFNVPNAVFDPLMYLLNSSLPIPLIATSPPLWDQGVDAPAIRAAAAQVGAFPLPAGSRDAVLLVTLPPGTYTAQTVSSSGSSGITLVEVYDADVTRDPASRLTNLSTRGQVDVGANLLIAGFVVSGPGPRTYLIRVAGDTLKNFNVVDTLGDPYLQIFRGDGVLLREHDDWDSPSASQPALRAAASQVGAFALTDRQEAAMLVTLSPGNYTAHVTSFQGLRTVPRGVALVEVYEMPASP
jgi:hypothetical protein